jgi:hypothetical protein
MSEKRKLPVVGGEGKKLASEILPAPSAKPRTSPRERTVIHMRVLLAAATAIGLAATTARRSGAAPEGGAADASTCEDTGNPVCDAYQCVARRCTIPSCPHSVLSMCAQNEKLGQMSEPFKRAFIACATPACISGSPPPTTSCVDDAIALASPSPAQTMLAAELCARCPNEVGPSCTAAFFKSAVPGTVAAMVLRSSDTVVAQIETTCLGLPGDAGSSDAEGGDAQVADADAVDADVDSGAMDGGSADGGSTCVANVEACITAVTSSSLAAQRSLTEDQYGCSGTGLVDSGINYSPGNDPPNPPACGCRIIGRR